VLRQGGETFEKHRVAVRKPGKYLHKNIPSVSSGVLLPLEDEADGCPHLLSGFGRPPRPSLRFHRGRGGQDSRMSARAFSSVTMALSMSRAEIIP